MNTPLQEGERTPDAARLSRIWRFANIELDEARRQIKVDGAPIELEPRPLELLLLLLRHAGEVVTKDEILDAVWPGRIVTEASLTKCMARLRKILGDSEQEMIRTAYGHGYRLAADVTLEARPVKQCLPGMAQVLNEGDPITGRPNWRLVRRLGTGGFGDAWLGEQSKSGEKRVFKFGLDGEQLSSLKREITLFRLLNSGLEPRGEFARILDWNLERVPYYIEVEWSPEGNLQQWASPRIEAGTLSVAQRLELAAQIADALAAAHSMGVLHKDLKPSNVLIELSETGQARTKLCDFGSGTALDMHRLEAVGITRLGFSRVIGAGNSNSGTPAYLAPELMVGGLPSVRSDIYAFGVLLYQLMIGDFRRPLAPGWEQDVPDQLLREDIAWAAAGDPTRRLADAAQLATHLRSVDARRAERELQDLARTEAIRTRQALERTQARRGLWQTLAATLLVALAVTIWLGIDAQRARQDAVEHALQARAVTGFLINDILAAANPMVAGTRDVQLRPLLDAASMKLEQRFADQPAVLAELQSAMGAGYAAMFYTDKAEGLLLAAEQGLAQTRGDTDPETQNARMALWYLYRGNIDLDKLYKVSERIAAAERAAGRPDSDKSYRARLMLASIPCFAKAPAIIGLSDCAEVIRPFYDDTRRVFGADDRTTWEMRWYLGVALIFSSREDQAEPVLREACPGLERYYGPLYQIVTSCQRYLAWALDANGKPDEAESILDTVAQKFDRTLGPDSQFTTITEYNLAKTLIHSGRYASAADVARRAIAGMEHQHASDPTDLLRANLVLADALVLSHQSEAGLPIGERALASAVMSLGAGAPVTLQVRGMLGEAYLHAGHDARAESLMRENLELGQQLAKRPEWYVGELEASLAGVLIGEHRQEGARPLLQDALTRLSRELGPGNHRTMLARAALSQLR